MISLSGMRWAFLGSHGHAGIRSNEIADGFASGGTALRFLGPDPILGVYRRDLQKRLGRWLVNQHGAQW